MSDDICIRLGIKPDEVSEDEVVQHLVPDPSVVPKVKIG